LVKEKRHKNSIREQIFYVGWDGLGPEYLPDSSRALGVEGGQLVEVAFGHPPAF